MLPWLLLISQQDSIKVPVIVMSIIWGFCLFLPAESRCWGICEPITSEMALVSSLASVCFSRFSLPQSDDFVTITTRISPPSIASAIDFLFFPWHVELGHNVPKRSPTVQPDGGSNLCFGQNRRCESSNAAFILFQRSFSRSRYTPTSSLSSIEPKEWWISMVESCLEASTALDVFFSDFG